MKTTAIAFSLALTACGTAPALEEAEPVLTAASSVVTTDTPAQPEQRASEGHPVAMGAIKGAGRGAAGCAMPLMAFGSAGPIGILVGGVITFYCLPFGIVGGALIGGISAAAPYDPSTPVTTANAGPVN